jgi:hypothetical protein
VTRKLVQNVRRRRDRIRTIEQRTTRKLRRSDETDRSRFVAGKFSILAGSDLRFLNGVVGCENFGRVGEVVTGLERDLIRLRQLRTLGKLGRIQLSVFSIGRS